MKKRGAARFITRAGVVAALYVVLTYLTTLCGLANGAVQFRISEMLCILPVFIFEAVPGLTIGCLIANTVSGGLAVIDIVFGTVATLIGALGAYFLRKLPPRLIWLATLPNILANTFILPPVILYAYGSEYGYWLTTLFIFISQLLAAGIGGTALYPVIKKSRLDTLM
ncbi:MAG: QueT transporter family protein [Clostridia bacterium]|nr:QueT transporter family protein [Clostridia bacterium]MBR3681617.1 QueT transporter family protein [Clostridia bacterium]